MPPRHDSNAGHSSGVAGVDARRATPPDPRLARWGLARCCQLDPSHPALVTREDPGVEPCLIPWKDYAQGCRQRTMTLDAIEFVRRFLMHVLPSGFVRIRHYGILANCHRREKLMRCRELLGATPMTDSDLLDSNSPPEPESPVTPTQVCPLCGAGRMIVIEQFPPLTMALVPLAEPDRCFTCDSS